MVYFNQQSVFKYQKLYYVSLHLSFPWFHFTTRSIYLRLATNFLNCLIVTYHTSRNNKFCVIAVPGHEKKKYATELLECPLYKMLMKYLEKFKEYSQQLKRNIV